MKKHTKDSPLDWVGSTPFFVLWGVGVVGPFFTGVSAASITVAVILYYVRMFFVTGFFHRYFSHRSFEATRFWQFIYAACTCTAVQKGPLWWAYTHRHHHKTSDTEEDFHSNFWWGFLESHVLWFLRLNTQKTDFSKIKDLAKYPELVLFENKFFYLIPPTLLAYGCYRLGDFLGTEYSTSGMQMLMVGFFTSTFALHHGTFTINSISHMWGL
jgi:stearoyl-CoA desaturase (delta-9 desaturase)